MGNTTAAAHMRFTAAREGSQGRLPERSSKKKGPLGHSGSGDYIVGKVHE